MAVDETKMPADNTDRVALSSFAALQSERDDLNRRLNDALNLLGRRAGDYSDTSPDSGPQHDQIVAFFRQLKLQDFQALSHSLYTIWQKKGGRVDEKPAHNIAWCRQKLAQSVLIEGSKLLGIRRTISARDDLDQVQNAIYDSIRTGFKMTKKPPADLEDKMRQTIARSVELLQTMSQARPAGCLLVPSPRTAFAQELHEPIAGCPDEPNVRVLWMVFPGYLVTSSNRLLEKVLVYTE